jgi:hypothetical protein
MVDDDDDDDDDDRYMPWMSESKGKEAISL